MRGMFYRAVSSSMTVVRKERHHNVAVAEWAGQEEEHKKINENKTEGGKRGPQWQNEEEEEGGIQVTTEYSKV